MDIWSWELQIRIANTENLMLCVKIQQINIGGIWSQANETKFIVVTVTELQVV